MNTFMKISFLALLMLTSKGLAFCQPSVFFDPETIVAKQITWSFAIPVDFNGDGLGDLFLSKVDNYSSNLRDDTFNVSGTRQDAQRFGSPRSWVIIWDNSFSSDSLTFMMPTDLKNTKEQPVVSLTGNQLRLASFIETPTGDTRDNFTIQAWTLNIEPNFNPVEISVGDYVGVNEADLVVIASNDVENKAFVFQNPFAQTTQTVLSPVETISFPAPLQSSIHSGDIDDNDNADLFFQANQQWHIWFANPSSQSAFLQVDGTVKQNVFIAPNQIKTVTEVLFGDDNYPLLVSFETEPESDMAYAIFAGLLNPDFNFISIPDKHLVGNKTHLYWFDTNQSNLDKKAVLTVERDISKEEAMISDRIDVYTIGHNTINIPNKRQILSGKDIDEQRILLRSLGTGDYDGDGLSDLILGGFDFIETPQTSGFQPQVIVLKGKANVSTVNDYLIYD